MNVFNLFWAFIAEVIGLVIASISYWLLWPLTTLLGSVGSSTTTILQYIGQLGIIIMIMVFVFVFPIAIALDDEGKIVDKVVGTSG